MSTYARLAIVAIVALLIAGGFWKLQIALSNADKAGYTRAQREAKEVADAQAETNRIRQRAAEQNYTIKTEIRDRFITTTITEVRNVTKHLDSCPIGPAGVLRLNTAALCASEDRPASCGAGELVR